MCAIFNEGYHAKSLNKINLQICYSETLAQNHITKEGIFGEIICDYTLYTWVGR